MFQIEAAQKRLSRRRNQGESVTASNSEDSADQSQSSIKPNIIETV